MREPDDLASLAVDFCALSGTQRREILGVLSSFERVVFSALLEGASSQDAEADQLGFLGRFSPWLREHIHIAEKGGGSGERSAVTPKTRAALVELANTSWANQSGDNLGPDAKPPRTLINALAALFWWQRRT